MTKPWKTYRFFGNTKKSYEEIWGLQKELVEKIARGQQPDSLIFCEHEEVITAGRRTQEGNILESRVPVYEIERGGDATWHGPGQLVVYPLFRLQGNLFKEGLHEYLRFCEEAIIQLLSEFGLNAGRFGPTGVWIKKPRSEIKKIASIGVAVRRWVTYHGISLNISNDLKLFSKIRPCNFESSVMTSLKEEGHELDLEEAADLIELQFARLLSDKARKTEGGPELSSKSASF